ncbi:MAG: hypothetical protein OXB84_03950, partial [Halobacteriovoraceae bacterium]|nr:hypothetical protein [Halobacteriovoraceae bacterium]
MKILQFKLIIGMLLFALLQDAWGRGGREDIDMNKVRYAVLLGYNWVEFTDALEVARDAEMRLRGSFSKKNYGGRKSLKRLQSNINNTVGLRLKNALTYAEKLEIDLPPLGSLHLYPTTFNAI